MAMASSSLCFSFCPRLPSPSPRCCTTFPSSSPDAPQAATFSLPLSLESLSLSTSHHPLPSIVNPSLLCANILWFNRPYNAQIVVGASEPAESVVRRFRKVVMTTGIISECRRRRYFETPREAKKRKKQAAQRRLSRRPRYFAAGKKETSLVAARPDDDADDNWGYTEEDA